MSQRKQPVYQRDDWVCGLAAAAAAAVRVDDGIPMLAWCD